MKTRSRLPFLQAMRKLAFAPIEPSLLSSRKSFLPINRMKRCSLPMGQKTSPFCRLSNRKFVLVTLRKSSSSNPKVSKEPTTTSSKHWKMKSGERVSWSLLALFSLFLDSASCYPMKSVASLLVAFRFCSGCSSLQRGQVLRQRSTV